MTSHKHAANMLAYAKDAAETDRPWERWQFRDPRDTNMWVDFGGDCLPLWEEDCEYRRKPAKPKEPWKPERPTWCEVWNDGAPDDKEVRLIMYYFNCAIGDEYTVPEPRMKYHDGDKGFWDHATPTTPPAWWPKEWV